MPAFDAVYGQKRGQFELISVAVDESNDPQGFVSQKGYSWTFAVDGDGARKYSVSAIPLTVFIDRNGNEVTRSLGAVDQATFESNLAQIL